MSYRRGYGHHMSIYHDPGSSSHSSDYIIRPPQSKSSEYISISIQPDYGTTVKLRHSSDSGYADSGSDYMEDPIETKDDHISPYAHDQGFVSSDVSLAESEEAQELLKNQKAIEAPTAEDRNEVHGAERDARHEKRSSRYDDEDAHYMSDSEPGDYFSGAHTRDRCSASRGPSDEDPPDYRTWRDGRGSKHEFTRSHGVRTEEPDSYEEAGELLDKYRKFEARYAREQARLQDRSVSDGFISRSSRSRRPSHYDPTYDPVDVGSSRQRYRAIEAPPTSDIRPEPGRHERSRRPKQHKKHPARPRPQPLQRMLPDIPTTESDFSHPSSPRGFSVADSDLFSLASPLEEVSLRGARLPHMPPAALRRRSTTSTYTTATTTTPSTSTPPTPRTAHYNALPPPRAPFAYTRAIRQNRTPTPPCTRNRYSIPPPHPPHTPISPRYPASRRRTAYIPSDIAVAASPHDTSTTLTTNSSSSDAFPSDSDSSAHPVLPTTHPHLHQHPRPRTRPRARPSAHALALALAPLAQSPASLGFSSASDYFVGSDGDQHSDLFSLEGGGDSASEGEEGVYEDEYLSDTAVERDEDEDEEDDFEDGASYYGDEGGYGHGY